MSKTHREASHYAIFPSLLLPPNLSQRHIPEHPQPISLTHNLSYSHQILCVLIFRLLGCGRERTSIIQFVDVTAGDTSVCHYPLTSCTYLRSSVFTSHFRTQTNYLSLSSTNQLFSQTVAPSSLTTTSTVRPPPPHPTHPPSNTPSYPLNALSKYCLSLVRFNYSVSSD